MSARKRVSALVFVCVCVFLVILFSWEMSVECCTLDDAASTERCKLSQKKIQSVGACTRNVQSAVKASQETFVESWKLPLETFTQDLTT